MVGVPGRSQGCHACRKRKIACSLEKPECLLCRNSFRKCPGYERERVFIVHNSSTLPSSIRRKQRPQKSEEKAISSPVSKDAGFSWNRCPTQSGTGVYFMSSSLEVSYSRNLTVTANRQLFLAGFLARYKTNSLYNPVSSGHWLAIVPQLTIQSPALESFALAFCTARLGHRLKDSQLVRNSLELYTRGLRELQHALWDPKTMYDDQTLGACMLCAIYEVYECPGRNFTAYLSHHDGCARLIQARGLAAHKNGIGHAMFVAFRLIGALQALSSKNTFLTKQEWNTIPFSEVPKAPINLLVDLLLEAPQLLIEADHLKDISNPFTLLEAATKLLQSCRELDRQQNIFYSKLEASVLTGQLYWHMPRPMPLDGSSSVSIDPALESILPATQFAFLDIRIAQVVMLHWAIEVMSHSGMFRLQNLIQDLHDGGVRLPSDLTPSEELLHDSLVQEQGSPNSSEPTNDISDARHPNQHSCLPSDESGTIGINEDYTNFLEVNPDVTNLEPPPISSHLGVEFVLNQTPSTVAYFCESTRKILSSVLFCLREPSRDLGLSVLVAPLKLAYDILRDWPEIEECQEYTRVIGQVLKYIGNGGSQELGTGGGVEIVKYF